LPVTRTRERGAAKRAVDCSSQRGFGTNALKTHRLSCALRSRAQGMTEYREEVVEASASPVTAVLEERTIAGQGVLRPIATSATPPVTEVVLPPAVAPTRMVRRWWRQGGAQPSVQYGSSPITFQDLAQFLRVAWFLLGLIEALIALRFSLALLGANPDNEFAAMVYAVTMPFVAPFRTLFPTPVVGSSIFEGYALVAMLVLFVIWWVAIKFLGVLLNRSMDV
jgi:hypothetical protein